LPICDELLAQHEFVIDARDHPRPRHQMLDAINAVLADAHGEGQAVAARERDDRSGGAVARRRHDAALDRATDAEQQMQAREAALGIVFEGPELAGRVSGMRAAHEDALRLAHGDREGALCIAGRERELPGPDARGKAVRHDARVRHAQDDQLGLRNRPGGVADVPARGPARARGARHTCPASRGDPAARCARCESLQPRTTSAKGCAGTVSSARPFLRWGTT
jgi:hypothetical protein